MREHAAAIVPVKRVQHRGQRRRRPDCPRSPGSGRHHDHRTEQPVHRPPSAIDGPKTVVLISEGFVVDDYQTFAEDAGLMAAAARASLYVMHLNDSRVRLRAADGGRRRRSRIAGSAYWVWKRWRRSARGYMFTVNGAGTGAFDRLQAELSGHYLLGIQPDPPRLRRQAAFDQHPGAVERRRRAVAPAAAERGAGLRPQHAAESGGGRPELAAAAVDAAASGGDICAAGPRARQGADADSRGHRPGVQRRQARVDRLRDLRSDRPGSGCAAARQPAAPRDERRPVGASVRRRFEPRSRANTR